MPLSSQVSLLSFSLLFPTSRGHNAPFPPMARTGQTHVVKFWFDNCDPSILSLYQYSTIINFTNFTQKQQTNKPNLKLDHKHNLKPERVTQHICPYKEQWPSANVSVTHWDPGGVPEKLPLQRWRLLGRHLSDCGAVVPDQASASAGRAGSFMLPTCEDNHYPSPWRKRWSQSTHGSVDPLRYGDN